MKVQLYCTTVQLYCTTVQLHCTTVQLYCTTVNFTVHNWNIYSLVLYERYSFSWCRIFVVFPFHASAALSPYALNCKLWRLHTLFVWFALAGNRAKTAPLLQPVAWSLYFLWYPKLPLLASSWFVFLFHTIENALHGTAFIST